ncbi:MAG: MFS transporter [Streptococcaceae bacterium]|jgi:DHA1 family tetracycline resistance protein-like MFS transporter|nr:MFS transporter [Streptococcaceae bacterium]
MNTTSTHNTHALIFGFVSVFLTSLGFGIINPVVPFLVAPYATGHSAAVIVTLLTAIYALFVFVAAPVFGLLSDRFGRKPLLLISFLGSAVGYLFFGVGGALWVLFAGRIIDGLTGGNISIILAYFADITPSDERSKYFGWMGAIVGIGTITGPVIGGLLAVFGNSVPMYVGAALSLANVLYGLIAMPESLPAEKRIAEIHATQLNPLSVLKGIFQIQKIRRLLLSAVMIWIAAGSLQSIFAQFAKDSFAWSAALIGLAFAIIGIMDILSQSLIMPRLLKLVSDESIVRIGIIAELIAYAILTISALATQSALALIALVIYGFGDSIFNPAFNGKLSKSIADSDQGRVQGGAQALSSLGRVVGPVIGGQIYMLLGHAAPMIMGILLAAIAFISLRGQHSETL